MINRHLQYSNHVYSNAIRELFLIHLKNKVALAQISKFIMVPLKTLYRWKSVYIAKGKEIFLEAGKPGRKQFSGRLLKPKQEEYIKTMIIDHKPSDKICGKIKSPCWDRKTILELIIYKFNIKMSLQSISNYCKRWGLTCKKPAKKAHEQDEEKVEDYKKNVFPELISKINHEKGLLVFLDETGFCSNSYALRAYSLPGITPIVDLNAQRFKKNAIIALYNSGKVRFMTYNANLNTALYIVFLTRLIKSSDKKIFLVADNLKVHHAINLMKWAEDKEDKIEFHFLPSYSPELNPVEYINNYLKHEIYAQMPSRNKNQLKTKVFNALKKLQKSPKKALKFFNHKNLKFVDLKQLPED